MLGSNKVASQEMVLFGKLPLFVLFEALHWMEGEKFEPCSIVLLTFSDPKFRSLAHGARSVGKTYQCQAEGLPSDLDVHLTRPLDRMLQRTATDGSVESCWSQVSKPNVSSMSLKD